MEMEVTFMFNHSNVLVVLIVVLCGPWKFIQSPMDFGPSNFIQPTLTSSMDFGKMYSHSPSAVLRPKSLKEVSQLLNFLYVSSFSRVSVAARGAGHSIHGQAQALDGIVIEMDSLPTSIGIHRSSGNGGGGGGGESPPYVDVNGGTLWIDLLKECLKLGLSPKSWTDYLYLTIGGTLSNGGISGQAFKKGPQISNVLELDVITGKGDLMTCSRKENSELFYGVLGGLGQFGIITRARIVLEDAPTKVRWVRVFYDDFEVFIKDQEFLVTFMEEWVDYVEGFMVLNEESLSSSFVAFPYSNLDIVPSIMKKGDGSKIYYCIEFAVYGYKQMVSKAGKSLEEVEEIVVRKLRHLELRSYSVEVSYFDFLNRVRVEEEHLRERGLWDVPHPWLNMFVPPSSITLFKDLLLENISPPTFKGPILIYPIRTDKWDMNMSAVLPNTVTGNSSPGSLVYIVGVLQSAPSDCLPGTECLRRILQQNERIIDSAIRSLSARQYLPSPSTRHRWRHHFGPAGWERLTRRKSNYDPLNILSPGQGIFPSGRLHQES